MAQTRTPQIPARYSSSGNPLIQPWNVRAEFEGPNTADFFNSINNPASPNASLLANPQIAVGPDEMLLVANSQIWRLPNGNAAGVIPTGLYPGGVLIGGQAYGAQRASLDNWIGAGALANLCPTGNTDPSGVIDAANTRSAVSCQIDNATVSYDQMHGRFLVLFTVVDTGMTFDNPTQSFRMTRPRKASWVLIVSRFAVLVDQACFQGTQPAASCPAPVIPGSGPNAAGSFAFMTPTPSFADVTGGVNTNTWRIVYGNSLNGMGGDNFGSRSSSNAGPWAGDVGVGNINSIPGILTTPAANGAVFDCRPDAVYRVDTLVPLSGGAPKVCYLPTNARLGIDNDTVIVESAVINGNINGANLSVVFNPPTQMPGYAGTRVRIIKKTALYLATPSLTPLASQFAAPNTAATSAYYDLYTIGAGPNGSVVNDGWIDPAAQPPTTTPGPPIPYTMLLNDVNCQTGFNVSPQLANEDSRNVISAVGPPPVGSTVLCRMTPTFYEPVHLRGRAQATYSNHQVPIAGPNPVPTSQTYLVGTVSSPVAQRTIYVVPIVEPTIGLPGVNFYGAIPFFAQNMAPQPVTTPTTFANPDGVIQANFRTGEVPGGVQSPILYVGDNRPHNVIFREGHLYDARVVTTAPGLPAGGLGIIGGGATGQGTFPGAGLGPGGALGPLLSTTTRYEIIQKLCSGAIPSIPPGNLCFGVNAPAPVTRTSTITLGSPNITVTNGNGGVGVFGGAFPVGWAVTGPGIPDGAVIIRVVQGSTAPTAPGSTISTITISVNATLSGDVVLTYGRYAQGLPLLVYQQYWQNTNAYAPMFTVPANVVTFGVGTPYNAINFLEKLFVATTVPPLSGVPDTAYDLTPAGTPAPLVGDFGFGDPRTRITYGSTGLVPTQLSPAANCYNNQLSPGAPTSQSNNPKAWASLFDTRCGVDVTDSNPQLRDPYVGNFMPLAAAAVTATVDFQVVTDGGVPVVPAQCCRTQLINVTPPLIVGGVPLIGVGWRVFGPNIPGNATVASFTATTVTLSSAPSVTNPAVAPLGVTISFSPPQGTAAYTIRGGEAIDPNDGSLWNFGAYAMKRDASITALAHWGTFAANYKLSFPGTDVYGNSTILFNDITGLPEQNFIQIAINQGLVPSVQGANGLPLAPPNAVPIPFNGVNSVLYGSATGAQPIPAGVRPPGNAPPAGSFGPDDFVTRREMAYWIIKSIMNDDAIISFLINSSSLNGVAGAGPSASSFADVPVTDPGWRYIEVMARRGYTSGCAAGVTRNYCPDYISTRRDLAAFMIRAKFGNIFGSALSGCAFNITNGTTSPANTIFPPAITTNCNAGDSGDNFALFVTGLPYFTDNPQEVGNVWYPFIQKMREMRITNGTSLGPASDGRNGTYSIGANALPPVSGPGSEGNLTRRQVVTFMVRGFFL